MLINPLPYAATLDTPLRDVPVEEALPYSKCIIAVDADQLVYAAGFSVEHSEPLALDKNGKVLKQFVNKSTYNKHCKMHPEWAEQVAELDFIQWIEPVENALSLVKTTAKAIKEATGYGKQRWYLTKGSTLWRNEDAKIQGYKANREEMKKPDYYDDIRKYMVHRYKAKICEGLEADDSIAALGRENEGGVVIVSGDKDLRTIPGYNLNISKISKGVTYITPLEACRNLYIQMLTGDRVDNIKGLSGTRDAPGWGIVKATKAIEEFTTEVAMATFVAKAYAERYPQGITSEDGSVHLTWQEYLVETSNLLFLRRYQHTRFEWRD